MKNNSKIEWRAIKCGEYMTHLMASRLNNSTRGMITKILEHHGDFVGPMFVIFNVEEWDQENPWVHLFTDLDELLSQEKGNSWNIWKDIHKSMKMSRNKGAKKYAEYTPL